jgi:hypothetical protein
LTIVARIGEPAYLRGMATYTLRLYHKRPGSRIETGDGALHFDAGDDANAVRYATTSLSEAIDEHDVVLMEGSRFVWEKPDA